VNAKEIIAKYLKENGYDGLFGDGCGCFVNDLIPCDSCPSMCVPGYRGVDCEGYEGCFQNVVPEKPNGTD